MSARYAIYFVPDSGTALGRFGASWLGWDINAGAPVRPNGFAAALAGRCSEVVKSPRRYGFHATLKAPFYLTPGTTQAELCAFADIAALEMKAVQECLFELSRIGTFLALIPNKQAQALENLAAQCTRLFDGFRAPLTEEDWQRRQPETLTKRQRAYLKEWGYPYIFEEFRFHLTLTGALDAGELQAVQTRLEPIIEPLLAQLVCIDSIAVVEQAIPSSNFKLIHRARLNG